MDLTVIIENFICIQTQNLYICYIYDLQKDFLLLFCTQSSSSYLPDSGL